MFPCLSVAANRLMALGLICQHRFTSSRKTSESVCDLKLILLRLAVMGAIVPQAGKAVPVARRTEGSMTIARKSLTLVRVGPVMTRSFSAAKKP